jgi:hypothetical protein
LSQKEKERGGRKAREEKKRTEITEIVDMFNNVVRTRQRTLIVSSETILSVMFFIHVFFIFFPNTLRTSTNCRQGLKAKKNREKTEISDPRTKKLKEDKNKLWVGHKLDKKYGSLVDCCC